MSDEDEEEYEDDEDGEGEDGEESASGGGLSGKQIVLFIAVPLLLIGGIGAGLYFSGVIGGGQEGTVEVGENGEMIMEEHGPPKDAVFYELPEQLVNLNASGRRSSFLKVKVTLELQSQEDVLKLEAVMPRIVDNLQVYLRELRAEDLRGSAGTQRLKEELLSRIKVAAQPAVVNDVLFKEFLVQ
ncbi:MAG: flagellar basal body protein FliL [Rhodospirillaceae bacterium]|jgi:flagellar protein FliL|nr:flagellar basal body protein FliL [Rhodospirillaceae bacterium]MBT5374966.1 flagellar basal body protein FliL [Rhodospirillaceae bacterium]MBT5751739.1 flagellar basal body protein FliL [Rhodospirillaceae bacterium]